MSERGGGDGAGRSTSSAVRGDDQLVAPSEMAVISAFTAGNARELRRKTLPGIEELPAHSLTKP